ncbi:MAG TPA: hypothetical protein PKA64_10875, partial [Myxococcota bacterium]|nr:hypothetical protein [Myxococcota bacterium]
MIRAALVALTFTPGLALAQTITHHGSLVTPAYHPCAAWLPDDGLVVVGGTSSPGSAAQRVQVIDPARGLLTYSGTSPISFAYPLCATRGGELWITDYVNAAPLLLFDPITGAATQVTSLPGVWPTSMAADAHAVYLASPGLVIAVDPTTGAMTSLPQPLVTRRNDPLLVATHGSLFLLGGDPASRTIERLDLANPVAWTAYATLPRAIVGVVGGAMGDAVVFTGTDPFGGTSWDLFELDLETARARVTDLYFDQALDYRAATSAAGRVWFVGGYTHQGPPYAPSGVVESWAPPTVGPDLDADGLIDHYDDDDDDDGLLDWDDPCPRAALAGDSDGDGLCDPSDPCPLDPDDDGDGDGLCADVDPCPLDHDDDSDGDGSCDRDDLCLGDDRAGDPDADGVCTDLDPCAVDPADDSDGDGYCDSDDLCRGDDLTGDLDGDGLCDDSDFLLLATAIRPGQVARFSV